MLFYESGLFVKVEAPKSSRNRSSYNYKICLDNSI